MKYLIILMLFLSSCSSATQYGKCIGLNGKEDPKLEYKYNGWNIALGILFVEMVIPPVIVLIDELKCPVGSK